MIRTLLSCTRKEAEITHSSSQLRGEEKRWSKCRYVGIVGSAGHEQWEAATHAGYTDCDTHSNKQEVIDSCSFL